MRSLLRHVRPEQLRELTLVLIIIVAGRLLRHPDPRFPVGPDVHPDQHERRCVAVVAVGQTLVVLTRNIDLSVGSIVGPGRLLRRARCCRTTRRSRRPSSSPSLIAIGAALGAVNGLLVAYGRVPAIVTTLGTLALYRVALVELSGAKTVTTDALPAWMLDLPRVTLVSLGAIDVRPLVVLARGHRGRVPAGAALPAVRPAPVRDRLQPGRGPGRGHPGPAGHLRRVRAVGRACGPCRVHVPGPLRQHHRDGRPGPGAAGGRGGRRRRREHLRRRRLDHRGRCSAPP